MMKQYITYWADAPNGHTISETDVNDADDYSYGFTIDAINKLNLYEALTDVIFMTGYTSIIRIK